jgi:hypothetical protein
LDGIVIVDGKIETRTDPVVPVSLDFVVSRILDLAPQAEENEDARKRNFDLVKVETDLPFVPGKIIKRITTHMLASNATYSIGKENNEFWKLDKTYHCLQGTCSEGWHILQVDGLYDYVEAYHDEECYDRKEYAEITKSCTACCNRNCDRCQCMLMTELDRRRDCCRCDRQSCYCGCKCVCKCKHECHYKDRGCGKRIGCRG